MKKRLIAALICIVMLLGMLPTAFAADPEPVAGPVIVADPESPTGYTGQFTYYDPTAGQVYFCGDLNLSNFADRTDTKVYAPSEYKPGLTRRGGSQFKEPMKKLDGGYWYYELPLAAGANQYWFNVDSDRRMMPDPANAPKWSPNSSATKDAYNCVYVPYDEKQDNELLKAREVELPRQSEQGAWEYVPYKVGSSTFYMGVYLPYGYDENRAKPYKTIYLVHGWGQDESDWMGIGSAPSIMDNLVAEGRTEPAVVVSLPNNNNSIGSQSDSYAALFGTVLPYIEDNYNVSKDRMDRALAGLSMGSRYTRAVMEFNPESFGYYGLFSCSETISAATPNLDKAHILIGVGVFDGANYQNATTTNTNTMASGGFYSRTLNVAGAHDFNTWSQLLRMFAEDYVWKPWAFGDGEAPAGDLDAVALRRAITNAENHAAEDFEAEGFEALTGAIADAKAALAGAATQDELDAAVKALNKAVAALVPKDGIVGLRDAFAEYFRIGTCLSESEVNKAQGREFTIKHFNSVTCENEMKPQYTLDQTASQAAGDNVTVKVQLQSNARAILNFCQENHIPMRGHVFCWHSQTPGWLFRENFDSNGAIVSQEIMDQRLESYIKNLFELLATEYPDLEFYSFDVVNEAFTDSNPATMRDSGSSGWISVYGDDSFIYKAFEYAHKYKPENCMLAYNDYNEYNPGKVEAIYELAKNLYEKGWLDCVGMQSHLTVPDNPTIQRFRAGLEKFASIGCKIMVTELDAQQGSGGEQQQAEYYQELFETLVDYKDQIEAVVFWGNNDGVSWRRGSNPLAFNSNYEPKASYYSILDAISDHEHVFEPTTVEPTCTERGYTARVCTVCGRTVIDEYTDALGHDWNEGVVTLEPTEEAPGLRTFTCKRCGAKKTKRIPRIGSTLPDNIDFTDAADADKFEVDNKETAEIVPAQGVTLTATADAFEPIGGGFGGGDPVESSPKDLIKVPVSGDWNATLEVAYDPNNVQWAFSTYFAFLAMEGGDYQNMAGIRATNSTAQDFLRQGGTIATPTISAGGMWGGDQGPQTGFTAAGTYWLRIEKAGDTYTCKRSVDGENYEELFVLEDTGIEAEYLVIDAYKTSTFSFGGDASWLFTLKSLEFDAGEGPIEPPAVDKSALAEAIEQYEFAPPLNWTVESIRVHAAAVAQAKAVYEKEDATQAEVDAATQALIEAYNGLTEPDWSALEPAVEAAGKVDRSKYTDESLAKLDAALKTANELISDGSVLQSDIDAAAAALSEAIDGLEKKPDDEFRFDDVKDPAKFYFDPVYWAFGADPQITNGVDATHFGPDNPCTRGHVVTFLWRAAGCPEPKSATTPFTDLKPGAFYEKAVAWAVEEGITKGMTDTTFAPDGKCNRGQIVTFLWRATGSEEPKSTKTPFTDLKPGAFYEKAVAWAVENNVTKGMTDTTFAPDGVCTRGQVVTFLYRTAD